MNQWLHGEQVQVFRLECFYEAGFNVGYSTYRFTALCRFFFVVSEGFQVHHLLCFGSIVGHVLRHTSFMCTVVRSRKVAFRAVEEIAFDSSTDRGGQSTTQVELEVTP